MAVTNLCLFQSNGSHSRAGENSSCRRLSKSKRMENAVVVGVVDVDISHFVSVNLHGCFPTAKRENRH